MAKKIKAVEEWHTLAQSGNSYTEIGEEYGLDPNLIHTALKNKYPKAGYLKKSTKTPYQKLFDQGIDLNVLKTLKDAGFNYKTIQKELFLPFGTERLRLIMLAQFGNNLRKSSHVRVDTSLQHPTKQQAVEPKSSTGPRKEISLPDVVAAKQAGQTFKEIAPAVGVSRTTLINRFNAYIEQHPKLTFPETRGGWRGGPKDKPKANSLPKPDDLG